LELLLGRLRRFAAMIVAPTHPSPGASPPAPAASGTPPLDWLDNELRHRLDRAAQASGMSLSAVCEQWLREGLERFEAHQPGGDPDGSGRCSLRTGASSLGPVPLPVQQ
jgi:hypothetical protein